MFRFARVSGLAVMLASSLAAPAAWAQQASGISGVVRDPSGGVLPGVTVEASSPALIEKVRTTVTDTQGRYVIGDLVPGSYTVIFTLAGFSVVRRDAFTLTSGFTAQVNADMKVGALEETITVTAAVPLVDISSGKRQTVETEPGLFRHVEVAGRGFRAFQLTSLLPQTGFDLHLSKMAEESMIGN